MTDRSRRVVDTLVQEDPEFVALCKSLYGTLDADLIHADVFSKDEPKTLKRIGIGATLVGGALGVKELGEASSELGHEGLHNQLTKAGKLIPTGVKSVLKNPKVRLGVVGGMLAGDGVATAMQARKPKAVAKNDKDLEQLAQGAYEGATKLIPDKFRMTGRKIGTAIMQAPKNKKIIGGVAATAGVSHHSGKKAGRREGLQEAYYGKSDIPDLELAGTFSKFDDAKMQAFGYASVVKKDGMPVIDRQGDYIDADEMEKAAYHYVQKSRKGGDMHRRTVGPDGLDAPHHVSDLIESMVFTPEKCAAMGLPDEVAKKLEGHWWVGYQIHDQDTWEQVRKQGRTGFSIHGKGKRQITSVDTVMGGDYS